MFKLTVVAGPNRGTSYALNEGETSIGRQSGNVIVLQSSKVSKRHCLLTVNGPEVTVSDQSSANGTFVNGQLSQAKRLVPGDKISVGEFVLELAKPRMRSASEAVAISGLGQPEGNVLQFPGSKFPAISATGGSEINVETVNSDAPPNDPKKKMLWYFERTAMPFFYGLNVKYQWKFIVAGLFSFMLVLNLAVSVYPLLEANRATILKESGKRAQLMARQIAEINTPFLASGAETKTTVGTLDQESGVRFALLIDLENRILAPAAKMNSYLASGGEAALAVKMSAFFRKGGEQGYAKRVSGDTIVAIEPVKILDSRKGRNVVVAMAVVALDASLAIPDVGEMGLIYSKVLIITALLGALVLFILYRMTLKPFEILNADLDRVLKGELSQVSLDFKAEEFQQLWDVINSAVQRIPKDGGGSDFSTPQNQFSEDFALAIRPIGEIAAFGLVVFNESRKILYLNPAFEEISGIRGLGSTGQEMGVVARDQALVSLCNDLLDQVHSRVDAIGEDFDFSGIQYKVYASALGGIQTSGYMLAFVRQEG